MGRDLRPIMPPRGESGLAPREGREGLSGGGLAPEIMRLAGEDSCRTVAVFTWSC